MSTTSFYGKTSRVRVTNTRIVRETEDINIVVPGAIDSEVEDEDEEDELARIPEVELETSGESDDDSDFVDPLEEEGEIHSDSSSEESTVEDTEVNKVKQTTSSKKDTVLRWRKRSAARVNSSFVGDPFPDPPQEDMTPYQYFKYFFDDDLICHIVHQTNLYSVQKCGT